MADSPRMLRVAAAQLGPIAIDESRVAVVERLRSMLRAAADQGAELVVFPELALTTFFPRWYTDDVSGHDHYYETAMPGPETQPLFDDAAERGVGFALGYAENLRRRHPGLWILRSCSLCIAATSSPPNTHGPTWICRPT